MRRAAILLALLGAALPASADPIERVMTGGARVEGGGAVSGGTDSFGVTAAIDRPDLNRVASVSYVYRWRGITSWTGQYRTIVRRPRFGLFFRSESGIDVITQGGTALGWGFALGLGARAGTADGRFSVVATPIAGGDAFWVVREGRAGVSARVPLGGELGLEGNVESVVLFAAARQFADVWPHRSPAYRFQAYAGAGVRFDLPLPREKGKPQPAGP